jgi:hypothetical protein
MVADAAFRRYEGQAVVVLPHGAEIKVLNPAGSLIFELLDGRHTVEDLVSAIRAEYEVDEGQARQDLTAFLDELEAGGMLSPATEG